MSAKYEAHQKIVKNQGFHEKEDERTLTDKQLLAIFDYTTFHYYTKEKVNYLVLFAISNANGFGVVARLGDVRGGARFEVLC